jgi:molecular chaperone GrpE
VTDSDQPWGTEGVEDPLGPPGVDEPADGDSEVVTDAVAQEGESGPETGPEIDPASASVEELIQILEVTTAARDEYLDALRRNQADFENYRKRAARQVADDSARAVESLVDKLLPVIDACEAAAHHGSEEVAPIHAALLGSLEKEGLERIDPLGEEFDPTRHEAVMHEPAGEDDTTTVVAVVMRAGFAWKGRVIRPAMVTVRG